MADDATTRKKMTNEQFLQGYLSIHQEKFDFNLDSEDEENEVFIGDVCFKEKCQSTVVNDLCDIEPIPELTDDQWIHMKEQADLMVFLLWEDKQLNNFSNTPAAATVQNSDNNTPAAATVQNSHNLIQSPQVTSSPAMNTRSKRKMQLISGSPYKVSPLQDITNRSTIKPFPVIITPQSIQKLASSKLETATNLALYDQLGLVNPMRLNFDDVEHSPKKSRCLNPYFTRSDSPLLTDEAWDVLLSSPDVNQSKAVRESPGLNARMSSDAILKKSRIRSKTVILDESSSILPSLLHPRVSSSNAKESKTLCKNNKERSSDVCEPELKSPRKSLLNVSFIIDKNSEALLGTATPPAKSLENVQSSQGTTEKPMLNESLTINKSQYRVSLNEKPALNESFTINKSYVCDSAGGKPALNESFTINKSIVSVSLNGKSTLNESFTVNDSSTRNSMYGKATLNESSTINKSVKQDLMNKKPVLNESFTIDKSHLGESVNEQPALNESFTIGDSQSVKPPSRKPVLNESFTINKSQLEEVITEKSTMNESFTKEGSQTSEVLNKKTVLNESFTINKSQLEEVIIEKSTMNESFTKEGSQTSEILNKKPVLNESFTLEKSILNVSFTVDASIEDSLVSKSSNQVERTISKKKSLPEKPKSLNSSLLNKSTTSDKSCEGLKKPLFSRKRTLASVIKTPPRQGAEPPSKTTVVSRSQLNKCQMPTIKSSIVPKPSMSRLQPSKTKFTLKNPNLNFNMPASTLQKDNHGMVKFEVKSVVPAKKPKSSLLVPNKLTRKSLKISPHKSVPKKEEPKVQSPILGPKRKCLISTPPIRKIGSFKPVASSLNGNTGVPPKTRLVLPSKLPSNIPKADTGKQMPQSRIPSKGPMKAFPTFGRVSEMKQSEGSNLPFAGKSKLKTPSPVQSRIHHINFKST